MGRVGLAVIVVAGLASLVALRGTRSLTRVRPLADVFIYGWLVLTWGPWGMASALAVTRCLAVAIERWGDYFLRAWIPASPHDSTLLLTARTSSGELLQTTVQLPGFARR